MDECINSLGEVEIFFTLDANNGYCKVKLRKQIETKPLSPHITEYVGSSACRFDYVTQRPGHIPAYNESHSPHRKMEILPCILRCAFDLFQNPKKTNRPRPQRTHASPQRRRSTLLEIMSVFHKNDWLFIALHRPSTPWDSIPYEKLHEWTRSLQQPHENLVLPMII